MGAPGGGRGKLGGVEVEGGVAQDELSHADKVHDLRDAEERGDDQGPAAGALQESGGALLAHDLTAEGWSTQLSAISLYITHLHEITLDYWFPNLSKGPKPDAGN